MIDLASLRDKSKRLRLYGIPLARVMSQGKFRRQFKLRGLNFDSIRDYLPGDDIRYIDWNATARFGKPYVKQFVDDGNVPLMLVVDASCSVTCSPKAFRQVLECALLLLYAAMHKEIPAGCCIFGYKGDGSAQSTGNLSYIPPRSGKRHYQRIERALLNIEPDESSESNLKEALMFVGKHLHPGALVFMVSDFCAADYSESALAFASSHTLSGCRVYHDFFGSRPARIAVQAEDAESSRKYLVFPAMRYFRDALRTRDNEIDSEWYRAFPLGRGLELKDCADVFSALSRFLGSQAKR